MTTAAVSGLMDSALSGDPASCDSFEERDGC